MRAVVYEKYGSPDVLEIRDVANPVPKGNEVVIAVEATVATPPDCAFRKGEPVFARLFTGLLRPKKQILGGTLAGRIAAVGGKVTRFKPGDAVYGATDGDGTYAELACLPEDAAIAPKPATMTFEAAASLAESFLTALPFLRDEGRIAAGQAVLVNGASGSVGSAAVQIAKHFGADVTGVCSTANVALVRSLGADAVIDYTRQDFTEARDRYDIIFDTVGKSSFARCKPALKARGIYLCPVISARIIAQTLATARSAGKRARFATTGLRKAADKVSDLALLAELHAKGEIKPVIDRRYRLADMREAHRHVDGGHKRGSVVIQVGGDAAAA